MTVDIQYTEVRANISHLLYMDDLKLLGRTDDDLVNEIEIVKAISKNLNMNFGFENVCKNMFKEK